MPVLPVGTGTLTELPEVVVTICGEPPLIVYVNVYGSLPPVPVKVMSGEGSFWHTLVVPEIVADG